MKRGVSLLLSVCLVLSGRGALLAESALTLAECHALALERSETLALTEEEIRQAEGQYEQVRSAVLPDVGARGTYLTQDTSGVASGSNSTFTRRDRPEAKLYARQRLFAGFREFAAMRAGKAQLSEKALARQRAAQLLYEDVAHAFYGAVELDHRIEILASLKASAEERVRELEGRVRIGRSRRSEVLSAQSSLAAVEADLQDAAGRRASALELLGFLTGRAVAAVSDERPDPAAPPPLQEALEKLPSRPDLLAAGRGVESAEALAASARREAWPTLNVEGGYYLKRTGFNEPIDWDVLFTAEAPFYAGGERRGAVKFAESRRRAAELSRSRLVREAERELRSAHSDLAASLSKVEKRRAAADMAERNYRAQADDYRLGLVNNLEVLSALNDMHRARLDYESARLEAKLNAIRLSVAKGELP